LFKKRILALFFLPILVTHSFAAVKYKSVESLFTLPENQIDIGKASLTLAEELFPVINIKAYAKKIDELVDGVRNLANGSTDPDYRIRALNTYLFRDAGFGYDFSDPYGKDIKNSFITGILDTKKGQCLTMPLLYLIVAQRLGYPVHAVDVPDHFFLRYVDPNLKQQNIEATNGGQYAPDEFYIKDLDISEQSIKNGGYLKTLSNRELLAILLAQSSYWWAMHGDEIKCINYLKHALEMYPACPSINDGLARAYFTYAKKIYAKNHSQQEADHYWEIGLSYRAKAKELGFVKPPEGEYIKKIKKKAKELGINEKGGEQ